MNTSVQTRMPTMEELYFMTQSAQAVWQHLDPAVQVSNRWNDRDAARLDRGVPDTVLYLAEGIGYYCRMGNLSVAAAERSRVAINALETGAAAAWQQGQVNRQAGCDPFPAEDTARRLTNEAQNLKRSMEIAMGNIVVSSNGFDRLAGRMAAFYPRYEEPVSLVPPRADEQDEN